MYLVLKSIGDRFTALFLLVLLSPGLLALYVVLKMVLKTDPIFTQLRPGLDAELFLMRKFRSMSEEKDINGILLPDGQRMTKIGKIIRSLSIDELPQLWNVLLGEMSFIGPRPLLSEYLPLYTETQARRHNVKPGITGWAQINGRNTIDWETKFEYDVWYVDNVSLLTDLRIIFLTIKKVVKRSDISSTTSATMEKFKGSKLC